MLPTSQPNAPVQAGLIRPVQAATPNLAALQEAFRAGYLAPAEIAAASTGPIKAIAENATAQAQIQDLQNMPIRRAQEMRAADQQAQMNDLQIQAAERQLNTPVVPKAAAAADAQLAEQYVKAFNRAAPLLPDGRFDTAKMAAEMASAPTKGKALTQTEVARLGSITAANDDLNRLEELFKQTPDSNAGPIAGRIAGLNPYNENAKLIEQAINAATPNLARGVFREVGVLTDRDIERYKNLFPTLKDPPEIRASKLKALRERLNTAQQTATEELQKAGRDVPGFTQPGASHAPAPAATPAPSGGGNLPVVTSQQQYDQLPPGAHYKTSDGKEFIKAG